MAHCGPQEINVTENQKERMVQCWPKLTNFAHLATRKEAYTLGQSKDIGHANV